MAAMVAITGNTFPVKDSIKAMGGRWNADNKCWMVPAHRAAAAQALVPAPAAPVVRQTVNVGSLSALFNLFATAGKAGLKFPKVNLHVNGTDINLYVAGPRSKNHGSISIQTDGGFGNNTWFGVIRPDGTFEPSRNSLTGLAETMTELAADPLKAIQKFARLTGRCMFCNRTLKAEDGQSQAAGMGRTCATKWGMLEHYKAAVPFAQAAAQAAPAPLTAAERREAQIAQWRREAEEADEANAALEASWDVSFDFEDGSDVCVTGDAYAGTLRVA